MNCTPALRQLNVTLGTSAAIVRTIPLLLVDLVTDDGITFGFPCGEPFALGRWCARHL